MPLTLLLPTWHKLLACSAIGLVPDLRKLLRRCGERCGNWSPPARFDVGTCDTLTGWASPIYDPVPPKQNVRNEGSVADIAFHIHLLFHHACADQPASSVHIGRMCYVEHRYAA